MTDIHSLPASGPDGSVIIYEAGDLRAWGPVPLAVVEAVIAAHRARGAS